MQTNIPKEISFLASLYSGWDSEKMSSENFFEAEKALKNFPAAALAEKNSNKKQLFDLKFTASLWPRVRPIIG